MFVLGEGFVLQKCSENHLKDKSCSVPCIKSQLEGVISSNDIPCTCTTSDNPNQSLPNIYSVEDNLEVFLEMTKFAPLAFVDSVWAWYSVRPPIVCSVTRRCWVNRKRTGASLWCKRLKTEQSTVPLLLQHEGKRKLDQVRWHVGPKTWYAEIILFSGCI